MLTSGPAYLYACIREFILVGENAFARPKGALRLSARRAFGAPQRRAFGATPSFRDIAYARTDG